jgi:hypothetical protein
MDNDVSQIIDRTAIIENLLNQAIYNYASPQIERFEFFWNVLLDSSILSLGSKVRVSMAIAQQLNFKMNQEPFHNVMTYRNAFAHHPLDSHPTLAVGKAAEDYQLNFSLLIIKPSGKTKRIRREQALLEFTENFEKAKCSLSELITIIKHSTQTQ